MSERANAILESINRPEKAVGSGDKAGGTAREKLNFHNRSASTSAIYRSDIKNNDSLSRSRSDSRGYYSDTNNNAKNNDKNNSNTRDRETRSRTNSDDASSASGADSYLHPASRRVYVHHIFDACLTMALARMQSKMKTLMGQVEHFAQLDDVWIDAHRWTGPDVTRMWSTIWSRLDPFLRTNTLKKNGEISVEKSR